MVTFAAIYFSAAISAEARLIFRRRLLRVSLRRLLQFRIFYADCRDIEAASFHCHAFISIIEGFHFIDKIASEGHIFIDAISYCFLQIVDSWPLAIRHTIAELTLMFSPPGYYAAG